MSATTPPGRWQQARTAWDRGETARAIAGGLSVASSTVTRRATRREHWTRRDRPQPTDVPITPLDAQQPTQHPRSRARIPVVTLADVARQIRARPRMRSRRMLRMLRRCGPSRTLPGGSRTRSTTASTRLGCPRRVCLGGGRCGGEQGPGRPALRQRHAVRCL